MTSFLMDLLGCILIIGAYWYWSQCKTIRISTWCHAFAYSYSIWELDHLVKLVGFLFPQQESEWVSPSFIIPKKEDSFYWISDLQQLNNLLTASIVLCQLLLISFTNALDKIYSPNLTGECRTWWRESISLFYHNPIWEVQEYVLVNMSLKCTSDIAQQ